MLHLWRMLSGLWRRQSFPMPNLPMGTRVLLLTRVFCPVSRKPERERKEDAMHNIVFENGWFLWFLLAVPLLVAHYIWRQGRANAPVSLSTAGFLEKGHKTFRHYLRHVLFALRAAVIALVIVVIARPQNVDRWQSSTTEGIDIILALDVSGSMLARDFNPDRLEASKNVATEFISGRPYDRIGLTVFSGESFTQCPLTT
ncbi:VWA domain-containing protein, partial [bacterium]|nr:VWA domain-containing protein [bacterium]